MTTAVPRRQSRVRGAFVFGLLPLAVLLGCWQFFVPADSRAFPPPSTWPGALAELSAEGSLIPAVRTTLVTFLLALAVATVLGTALGMLIGSSRRLERPLTPVMDFFRTLPPPAMVPVLALLLGTNTSMAVTVVVLASLWPILLNTASERRNVPPVRMEMARSLGLRWSERVFKVLLPSLAPGIMLGVRVAVSIALIVTLLVDILGTGEGIGRELMLGQQSFKPATVWALLLVIGVFGYLLNGAVAAAENRLMRKWGRRR
ncbi:ABC transporter permease [Amycolatopsis pithecellobii]|uniref:ABC transporter permease subunit n=1 Tax=Amycolatopsis pithecellobii TaxID=664692 RepID=A0A6N7YUN8_9PSEU|nr:ABC transporter permease [Amycolatopsis pithecellobii]MTD55652.1 ABC transporter permease subunit [Amycolatopsis pithecellobii]